MPAAQTPSTGGVSKTQTTTPLTIRAPSKAKRAAVGVVPLPGACLHPAAHGRSPLLKKATRDRSPKSRKSLLPGTKAAVREMTFEESKQRDRGLTRTLQSSPELAPERRTQPAQGPEREPPKAEPRHLLRPKQRRQHDPRGKEL